MDNKNIDNKRRSLIDFQKDLISEFEKIQNSSLNLEGLSPTSLGINLDLTTQREGQETLGISFIYHDEFLNNDLRIFLPLSSLNHILSNTKFEKSYLTKQWIRGFTHFRGDSYSIIDPVSLLNGHSNLMLDSETRIILFKGIESLRYGFVCRDISLINLEQQYISLKINNKYSNSSNSRVSHDILNMDGEVLNIFKSVPNFLNIEQLMSNHILAAVEIDNQPAKILNLAHIKKYAAIYKYVIDNAALIKQKQESILELKDSSATLDNQFNVPGESQKLDIFTFARNLFIDANGFLSIVVDSRILNQYLYYINSY